MNLKTEVLSAMERNGSLYHFHAKLLHLFVADALPLDSILLRPFREIPRTPLYTIANHIVLQYLEKLDMKLTLTSASSETKGSIDPDPSSDSPSDELDLDPNSLWIHELLSSRNSGDRLANFQFVKAQLRSRIKAIESLNPASQEEFDDLDEISESPPAAPPKKKEIVETKPQAKKELKQSSDGLGWESDEESAPAAPPKKKEILETKQKAKKESKQSSDGLGWESDEESAPAAPPKKKEIVETKQKAKKESKQSSDGLGWESDEESPPLKGKPGINQKPAINQKPGINQKPTLITPKKEESEILDDLILSD
jgi:hypothetical protein